MIKITENCNGCHACATVCPKGCITMEANDEGFLYPKINLEACIHCGLCSKICPIEKTEPFTANTQIQALAAINKDDDVRAQSSSGGVFTAIAKEILQRGGVIFGAAFEGDFSVAHRYVENEEDLKLFRGSKYVQSKIGDSYKKAEEFLKAGRWVLFTGTPCQISGLYAYLRKSYNNLITQDIICHGVPSPLVWQKYIDYRKAEANGGQPREITFRAKDESWKTYSVVFSFEDETKYRQTVHKDPMMKAFLRDLCLRPSCYDCKFKSKHRVSDITLADFWGIQKVLPEMDDDKGTSLVILHSPRGLELFEKIKDNLIYKQTDFEEAIFYNPAMIRSVNKPTQRDGFMKTVKEKGFKKAERKYLRVTTKQKIKKVLSKIKRKILRRK